MNDQHDLFLGVMGLQEAKNHQLTLKEMGIDLVLKSNPQTCTTGCRVTVEVWADLKDSSVIQDYLKKDYLKHVQGHTPNFEQLSAVFDSSATEVLCQACGAKFSPQEQECPECGLVYF